MLRLQLLTATWLSYAGFYFTRKVYPIVKKQVKDTLVLDDQSAAHIWTVYLVTYMLGQFLVVRLARRGVSSRQQLLVGMSVSVACSLALGLLLRAGHGSYALVLGVMGVHGLAQGMGWANNVALVANWTHRRERGRIMSVWGTCYQLGAVAAKSFAGFMVALAGLTWAFWAPAAVLAAIVVLFHFWGRERPPTPIAEEEPVLRREAEPRVRISHLRLVVAMGLIYFTFKFLRYALESWSPMIVQEHFGRGPAFSAYATTAFDWLGFTGVLVAGWASDRWFRSRRTPVIFGMSVGALAATIVLWWLGLQSVWLFVLLLAVIGFMDMGPDSLLAGTAAVEAGDPRQAAVSVAIINGLGSIGPIFQEELIGWVKTDYGIGPVFLVLVGVAGLATASTAVLWWQSPRL